MPVSLTHPCISSCPNGACRTLLPCKPIYPPLSRDVLAWTLIDLGPTASLFCTSRLEDRLAELDWEGLPWPYAV